MLYYAVSTVRLYNIAQMTANTADGYATSVSHKWQQTENAENGRSRSNYLEKVQISSRILCG